MDPALQSAIAEFCEKKLALSKEAVAKFLTPKSTRQGEAFWNHRDAFGLLISHFPAKERLARFFDLVNFLGTQVPGLEGEQEMARANWLLRFNRVFCCKWINIKSACRRTDDPRLLVQILTEIVDARVYDEPAFKTYREAHGEQAIFMLYDLRAAWVTQGRPIGGMYLLIATLHRHHLNLLNLTQDTCADFQQLIRVHPPNSKFRGFGRWGRGDAADKSIATNIVNHFKKHALNAGLKPLDWPKECVQWWDVLRIEITLETMDLVSNGPKKLQALSCFNSAKLLPADKIEEFLTCMNEELKQPGSRLMHWFVSKYSILYRDKALAMATSPTSVAVFMERGAVYVSGACNNFYVIGRIDEGVLTISSFYVAKDMGEKLTNRSVLWTFT